MKINISKEKSILPTMPFIIYIGNNYGNEGYRIISKNNPDKFYLTNPYGGETWTSDTYTYDFLKKKILNKDWIVVDSELNIEQVLEV